MNFLDACIILVVALLVLTGFFSGVGRILASFVAIYFATIVSAASYEDLSAAFRRVISELSRPTANLLAFIFLMLLMGAIFYVVITQTFKSVQERRGRFAILDNVGGAAFAIIVGILTITMTLSVSVILLGAFNQTSVAGGVDNLGAFGRQVRGSELAPVFLKLQPGITTSLKPWFPNGLPEILEPPPASAT